MKTLIKKLHCWILGHLPHRPSKDPNTWFCKRCNKWLDLNGKI